MQKCDNLKHYLIKEMEAAMKDHSPGVTIKFSDALMNIYQAEALTTIADVMASKWERENADGT